MRIARLILVAIVAAGCGALTPPGAGSDSSVPDPSTGLRVDGPIAQALETCGMPADASIGWSGHATLSGLGLPLKAGDVEGMIVVTAEPLTGAPFDALAEGPPIRWFCAVPDAPALVGSDFVIGPVPAAWDPPPP